MRRLLVCLLFAGTLGAGVVLGPEEVLSPIGGPAPMADWDWSPRAVPAGNDFLTVWNNRTGIYTRRWRGGEPVVGHRVVQGWPHRTVIATTGTDYLLAWTDSSRARAFAMRLDENGHAAGPVQELGDVGTHQEALGDSTRISLSSNGTSYLFISNRKSLILDLDGKPLQRINLGIVRMSWARAFGAAYRVVYLNNCGEYCAFLRFADVTEDGRVDPIDSGQIGQGIVPAGVAIAGDRVLIAHHDPVQGTRYAVFTSPWKTAEWHDVPHYAVDHAAWDGSSFAVFLSGFGGLRAFRVAPDGSMLDDEPFPLAKKTYAGDTFVAAHGNRQLVLWMERRGDDYDVKARSISGFAELPRDAPSTVLSIGPNRKVGLQIARAGENELVAWADEATGTIEGRINGHDFELKPFTKLRGRPAIASGDRHFALAWIEEDRDRIAVFMTRVTFDGFIEPPRLVDAYRVVDEFARQPALTWGNGAYYIVIADLEYLHVFRMPEAGDVRYVKSIREKPLHALYSPRIAWNGSDLVIAYHIDCCPPYVETPPALQIRLLHANRVSEVRSSDVDPAHLSLAIGNGRVTVATRDRCCRFFVDQRTLETRPIRGWSSPSLGACVGTSPVLLWNGSEYVFVFDNDSVIRASRLDAQARPLDELPITIADGSDPAAAAIPGGLRILYSRADPENDGAVRVYARTLEWR